MATQGRASRVLQVFLAVAILAPAIWVSTPRADASVVSATDTAPLTVSATWVLAGHNDPGQEITMAGDAPAAAGCDSTQTCHGLFMSLLAADSTCPATWDFSNESVVPLGKNLVAGGPFSKTFTLGSSQYPELENPSQYQLCGYLVDQSTSEQLTVGAAQADLSGQTVPSGSMIMTAHPYDTANMNGYISIDVTGTAPEVGRLYVDVIDDTTECASTTGGNAATWFGGSNVAIAAGVFSKHFDVFPKSSQDSYYDPPPPRAGDYGVCAYLISDSAVVNTYNTATPSATAFVYHVVVTVPDCPSTVISIVDAQQTVPFWALTTGEVYLWAGAGSMHLTLPGRGEVRVVRDDGKDGEGEWSGRREVSKAGTYGVDIDPRAGSKEFRDLYKSQQSKKIGYKVRFTPLIKTNYCVAPGGTQVESKDVRGTKSTSINWVPAKTHSTTCYDSRCPQLLTPDCHTVESPCYERALTLNLTRKAMSGTVKESGGSTHCRGNGNRTGRVLLFHLMKGKWNLLQVRAAEDGKYSVSFGSWVKEQVSKGGTFRATMDFGGPSDSPYSCPPTISNAVKLERL